MEARLAAIQAERAAQDARMFPQAAEFASGSPTKTPQSTVK
jgi:hypothetical protein